MEKINQEAVKELAAAIKIIVDAVKPYDKHEITVKALSILESNMGLHKSYIFDSDEGSDNK